MRGGLIVGLLAGIVLQYPIAGDAHAQQRGGQSQPNPQDEARNAELRAIKDAMERIAATQDAKANQSNPGADQKHAQDDLAAQQEMARWAFPIFVATGFGALFTLGSVIALVLIFRAQQKLSMDQTRAYLEVVGADLHLFASALRFRLAIFNNGQTLATNLRMTATFVYLGITDDEGRETGPPKTQVLDGALETLPVKTEDMIEYFGDVAFSTDYQRSNKGSGGGLVGTERSEGPRISIDGAVTYLDAFGVERTLPFHLRASWVVNLGEVKLEGVHQRRSIKEREMEKATKNPNKKGGA